MNECIYCKSTNIEKDLPLVSKEYIGSGNHPGIIGPFYKVGEKKFLGMMQTHGKHEPMYADLCKQCGGMRLHIKNVDKEWLKEFPTGKNPIIWNS